MYRCEVLRDQGQCFEMEDGYAIAENPAGSGVFYGGVFDGHRGEKVAQLCARKLWIYFLIQLFSTEPRNARVAFREAYARLGLELSEETSGSCAATFCLDGDMFTTANVGDCRILVVGRDDCRQLTVDHTPENADERKRIFEHAGPDKLFENLGRLCLVDSDEGGLLQPSRSFGDAPFRRSGLSYAPDVAEYRLNPDDLCVIAATDGLFGKIGNDEVAEITRRMIRRLEELPRALAHHAALAGSRDNITIIALDVRR